jgi:FAD synthetase
MKISGLYIRCQSPFAEVDEFVNHCQTVYNIDLITVDNSLKNGLGAFLAERPSIKAILIGTRATDPNGGQ